MAAPEGHGASPWLKIALAQILVGGSVTASKLMTDAFPVYLASTLRLALALAVLVPLVFLTRQFTLPSRGQALLLFIQAGLGTFAFNVFLLYGLRLTPASAAGAITSLTPVATALAARLTLGERLSARQSGGLALALAGLALLNVPPLLHLLSQGGSAGPLLGNLLILGVVATEASFVVLGRAVRTRHAKPLPSLTACAWLSLFGLAWFLPFGLPQLSGFNLAAVPAKGWLGLGYYSLAVSVAATTLWFSGLRRVPAPVAGLFSALIPVAAVLSSWLVLGDRLAWQQAAGMLLILGSLPLVVINEPMHGLQ